MKTVMRVLVLLVVLAPDGVGQDLGKVRSELAGEIVSAAESPRRLFRLAGGNADGAFRTGLDLDLEEANRRYTEWLMAYTPARKPRR